MKKIIFIVLLIISSTTFGQKLSFKELFEKSKCNSYDCFGDFVTKKGFSFNNIDEESGSYNYISSKKYSSNTGVLSPDVCAIGFGENGCQSVVITTANKAYYTQLLNEIKSYGFVFSNTTKDEYGINVYYKLVSNPNVIVDVVMYTSETKGLKSLNYQILIDRCR
jgi:hypothetical protein